MTTRVPRRGVFHVHNEAYHFEDSLRGVRLAVARAFRWIDLDCHVTKDGVLVITHWPRPMIHDGFYDLHDGACDVPGCIVKRDQAIEELTWTQVSRLRTHDKPPYRISRADHLVPIALRKGLKVELEMKSSRITAHQLMGLTRAIMQDFPTSGSLGECVQVKAFPKFLPALQAAHDAGYTTIALTHPGQRHLPESAKTWLDYWRGKAPIWSGR